MRQTEKKTIELENEEIKVKLRHKTTGCQKERKITRGKKEWRSGSGRQGNIIYSINMTKKLRETLKGRHDSNENTENGNNKTEEEKRRRVISSYCCTSKHNV
jgi:hypothetical protein